MWAREQVLRFCAFCLLGSLRGQCASESYRYPCSDRDSACITSHSTSLLQVRSTNPGKQNRTMDMNSNIHFFPEKNVLLCACAKCGTTSLHTFVYRSLFGREWNYTDAPWITHPERWEGKLIKADSQMASQLIENPGVFSVAILRDPLERIKSSWKSKVACREVCPSADGLDRKWMVPDLLAIAGNTSKATCLSFSDFVDVLWSIHVQNKEHALDRHFSPQHLGCFKHLPREKWSMVADITDSTVAKELGRRLTNESVSEFPSSHNSECTEDFSISDTVRSHLQIITNAEYAALGLRPRDVAE